MKALPIVFLLTACATTPTPPVSTPPPPVRTENVAIAHGVVTDADGRPVEAARIRAWAADSSCRQFGEPVIVHSGSAGTYEIEVPAGAGPQLPACLSLHVISGGSAERAQVAVTFSSANDAGNRRQINLRLPRAPELTRQEADRLAGLFTLALKLEQPAVEEISLYFEGGITSVHAAVKEVASYIRGVESFELVKQDGESYTYELRGVQDRTRRITISRAAALHRIRVSVP